MKIIRVASFTLTALLMCAAQPFAQQNRDFESDAKQWIEVTVLGGWALHRDAVNEANINRGSSYLFDNGAENRGSVRAEIGWGYSEDFIWSFGLWYAKGSGDGVSTEITDPGFEPAPDDEFQYYRSVEHTLTAPYISGRYFLSHSGRMSYFVSGGTMLAISRATFRYHTVGLASGELLGTRDMGDTRFGLFASIGLRRLVSSVISVGAEAGYRQIDKMRLKEEWDGLVTPPLNATALAVTNILNADYSGPFAMLTLTVRP